MKRTTRLIAGVAAGVLAVAAQASAAPRSLTGPSVEHHMEGSILKVVMTSPRQLDLDVSFWTPNHSDLSPAMFFDRRCDGSTACHAEVDLNGKTQVGRPICSMTWGGPKAYFWAEAYTSNSWTWLTGSRTKVFGQKVAFC